MQMHILLGNTSGNHTIFGFGHDSLKFSEINLEKTPLIPKNSKSKNTMRI